MKQSVTAILSYQDEIYAIKRKDSLKAFPGYISFPGGKIDKEDYDGPSMFESFGAFPKEHTNAVVREVIEELGIDLRTLPIKELLYMGESVSPDFNPVRFANHYYLVELEEKPQEIQNCDHEIEWGKWIKKNDLNNELNQAHFMAVPPTRKLIDHLAQNDSPDTPLDFRLPYDSASQVPWIEVVTGVTQFMPLSHTLPPANRTNCFHVSSLLIDPSPKDIDEYDKLKSSLQGYDFDKILITHHHSDHYQFSNEMAIEYQVPLLMSQYTKNAIEAVDRDYFNDVKVQIISESMSVGEYHGEELKVYEVPGHDRGQLAIAPESLTWFLVGDLIQGIGTVVISAPEGDMSEYYTSLEKVINLNPTIIMPSHGIPLGGTYKLEETLKHRKMRESQILTHLVNTQDLDFILDDIYQGLPDKLRPYAKKTLHSHLRKLVADGLIEDKTFKVISY